MYFFFFLQSEFSSIFHSAADMRDIPPLGDKICYKLNNIKRLFCAKNMLIFKLSILLQSHLLHYDACHFSYYFERYL